MKHTVKLILGACALLAHTVSGQTWASPRDSEGWTILNPSSDSRIIYVSTTDGNNSTAQNYTVAQVGSDPRHPTISVNAYATLGAALAQMRDTYPDWILLKTGDTFPEHQINLHHIGIGRSASERMVFSYYGDSSQRPVILKPDIRAWRTGLGLTHDGIHFWAFVGIEFYNSSADPDSPDYISSTDRTGGSDFLAGGDNLLIEDCKFNFWGLGVQGPERPWVNLEIRRNILYKQYYYDSCVDRNRRPSAVYLHRIENYLIEENITDYGGWNPDIPGASRNAFNHGFYIQFTCEGELYFRGNIIARASGNGVQSRSGGLVEKNLVIQSPAGLFTAHDTVSGTAADPGLTAVRHNVVLEGLTMGNCPQATSANWGIPLHETLKSGTEIEENIVAHNLDGIGTVGGIDIRPQCVYINNIVYDWGPVPDTTNPGWSNPERSVGGYHATIGGTATTEAFIDACVNRGLRVWPYAYSAYAVIDYIRDGFDLAPVGPGGSSPVAVTGVSVTPASLNLSIGNTSALAVQVSPSNASNQSVSWSSSNSGVATVSSSGVVSAVGAGSATITVTTNDGSYTDTTSVSVSAVSVTGVTVTPASASVAVSGTVALNAQVSPSNATNQGVAWSTSNASVATVSSSGVVTGVAVGSATITATTSDGSFTDTCAVTVSSAPIAVTGVSVTPASLSLEVNETDTLTAQVTPSNATDQSVSWSSSNTSVAIVNASGVVTGVGTGSATITATTNDGSFTDTSAVTVTSSTGSSTLTETLDRDYWLSMGSNNISTLTGDADFPSNPDGADALGAGFVALGWAGSSNPGGATNWANSFGQRIYGYLVPETSGNYVFWISSDDNSVLYLSTDEEPGNSIEIASVSGYTSSQQWNKYTSQKSASISLTADTVYYIEVLHKEGGGGTNCAVGWAKPGESTTAPSEVIPAEVLSAYSAGVPTGSIPVTAVTVSPGSLNLTVNDVVTLTAQVSPMDATDPTVAWSSSNSAVVTVDSDGEVTAVAAGSATITATTNDGSFTDTCIVTVVNPTVSVTGVNVTPASVNLGISGTAQLTAQITPSNATNQAVGWSTSNASVATVNSSGFVTGVAAGTATITATTDDGSFTDTTAVTVISGGSGGELTGTLDRDYWLGISGTSISNLTNDADFPTSPDGFDELGSGFVAVGWAGSGNPGGSTSWGNNFGERIYGYIVPETTGTYVFWIASDDYSELHLSTDENPANSSLIASVSGWTHPQTWNKYTSQKSAAISLTAGEIYYIEVLHKEAGGGTHCAVAWAKPGESTTAPSEVVPASVLSAYSAGEPSGGGGTVSVTGVAVSPDSVSLTIFETAMLVAQVSPADATDKTVAWSSSNTSVATVGTDGMVTAVAVGSATITVTTSDGSYTDTAAITVQNSSGGGGTPLSQTLDREYWLSIGGNSITSLTGNADYPSNPDGSDELEGGIVAVGWSGSAFPGGSSNWANSFGQRILGYLVPETTGNYVFWIASDDHSVLYLSTDEDQANRVEIASVTGYTAPQQWDKYTSQKSATISLTAGQVYYIEILHKEGGGGTHCAVGWAKPGESTTAPSGVVPASVLSAYSAGQP